LIKRLLSLAFRQWSNAPLRLFKIFRNIADDVMVRPTKKVQAAICPDNPEISGFNMRRQVPVMREVQHGQLPRGNAKFLHQFFMHLRRATTLSCSTNREPSLKLSIQYLDTVHPIVDTPYDMIAIDFAARCFFENPRHCDSTGAIRAGSLACYHRAARPRGEYPSGPGAN
jgi:hypothetical protein